MRSMKEENMNNCPYCQKTLEKPFKRKAVCPFCNKDIYVRNGQMVTEFESRKVDWLRRVENFEVTASVFDSTMELLREKFKTEPMFNDICWGILNKLLGKYANDPQNSKMIYYEMAWLLQSEGKNNSETIIKANQIELLEIKKNGFKYVSVETANDDQVCVECRKMESERIPIDLAIETNPIPHRCKNKYCRCSYGVDFSLVN